MEELTLDMLGNQMNDRLDGQTTEGVPAQLLSHTTDSLMTLSASSIAASAEQIVLSLEELEVRISIYLLISCTQYQCQNNEESAEDVSVLSYNVPNTDFAPATDIDDVGCGDGRRVSVRKCTSTYAKDAVTACLCRDVANSNDSDIIECHGAGCETHWVRFQSI